jgi:tetratricopeptide (TPR) repeat protein
MYWEPSVYEGKPLVGATLMLFLLGLVASKSKLSDNEASSLGFAADDLDYGLRLRPGVANVYRPMLTRCLMATGQRQSAIAEYEKVLEAESLDIAPDVVKKIAIRTIAENLVILGRSGRAIEILEKLAEELPAEKGLYLRIAELQHKENRFDDVGVSLRKEIERDPDAGENWLISHVVMRSASPLTPEWLSGEIKSNPKV